MMRRLQSRLDEYATKHGCAVPLIDEQTMYEHLQRIKEDPEKCREEYEKWVPPGGNGEIPPPDWGNGTGRVGGAPDGIHTDNARIEESDQDE